MIGKKRLCHACENNCSLILMDGVTGAIQIFLKDCPCGPKSELNISAFFAISCRRPHCYFVSQVAHTALFGKMAIWVHCALKVHPYGLVFCRLSKRNLSIQEGLSGLKTAV